METFVLGKLYNIKPISSQPRQRGNARALVESPGSRPGSRPNTGQDVLYSTGLNMNN